MHYRAPRLRRRMSLVVGVFVLLGTVTEVTAQETTITVPVDVWSNACAPAPNTEGVQTTDYASSPECSYYYEQCHPGTGTWRTDAPVPDQLPSDAVVTSIKLRLFGGTTGTVTGRLNPTFNGTALGSMNPQNQGGNYAACYFPETGVTTNWMGINHVFDFPAMRYDGGFPEYISGGRNTLDLGWTTGASFNGTQRLSVETAELVMTYVSSKVYFDIDGDFATNKLDDLPKWIPGGDINGNSLPHAATPIQTVDIHVITAPKVRGDVVAEFTQVSRYPGKTMNFPIASTDVSPDMYFGGGSLTTRVTISASSTKTADTILRLFVNDYAAQGVLKLTIPNGTKNPFVVYKSLPMSVSGNGLPRAGWNTSCGKAETFMVADASEDFDTEPSGPTQAGDGFSAFEEFRGFVVNSQHVRLHPRWRDLFLDVDPQIDQSFLAANLPYTVLYVRPGESKAVDVPRFGGIVARTAPVMNPNRGAAGGTSVPGARADGQRGIRLVYTSAAAIQPKKFDSQSATFEDAWQFGIEGIAWQDQMNIEVHDDTQAEPFLKHSPNEIRFVEVLERTQTNNALHMGASAFASSPQPLYRDANGQVVPDCYTSPPGTTPCDRYRYADSVIVHQLLTSTRRILHVVPNYFDDYYTKFAHAQCGTSQMIQLAATDFALLPALVVGHEVGHSLTLDHHGICGGIMYGLGGLMPDNLPFPTRYESYELQLMRTHR